MLTEKEQQHLGRNFFSLHGSSEIKDCNLTLLIYTQSFPKTEWSSSPRAERPSPRTPELWKITELDQNALLQNRPLWHKEFLSQRQWETADTGRALGPFLPKSRSKISLVKLSPTLGPGKREWLIARDGVCINKPYFSFPYIFLSDFPTTNHYSKPKLPFFVKRRNISRKV